MSASTDQAAVLYLRITCSVNGIFYASMYALDSFALASGAPKLALANSLIDAFIMRMGLAWLLAPPLGLRIHRNLCGAGSGAGSARPHRLRLPPAMGERKLAREAIALAPESFDL